MLLLGTPAHGETGVKSLWVTVAPAWHGPGLIGQHGRTWRSQKHSAKQAWQAGRSLVALRSTRLVISSRTDRKKTVWRWLSPSAVVESLILWWLFGNSQVT